MSWIIKLAARRAVIAQWAKRRDTDWKASVRFPTVANFILPITSKPTLGPTQPPIQWVLRLFFRDNAAPPTNAESRMVELYLHSPICLHGVALNKLSTGTILPLPLLTSKSVKLFSI
jgi:hypothetical protein